MINEFTSDEKHILAKLDRVRPECGEDSSKERYRYLQWLSCKNAVIEGIRENHHKLFKPISGADIDVDELEECYQHFNETYTEPIIQRLKTSEP